MPAIESYDKSVFHLGLNKESLAFDDLFDLNHWNTMSQELGYSALVTQQYFLEHASRDIVYVKILYTGTGTRLGCLTVNFLNLYVFKSWYKYLSSNKFAISKRVCIGLIKKGNQQRRISAEDI